MNQVLSETIVGQNQTQFARFGVGHGYRFNGDFVHLNAMFTILDGAAHERAWALQLRARPVEFAAGVRSADYLVAEAVLPPISEIADDHEGFEVSAFARPPAGQGAYEMSLVLVARRSGGTDEVHDRVVYQRPEAFSQPALRGAVGFRLDGERVVVTVAELLNPRDAANVSGTLALELRGYSWPYSGGNDEGTLLAGVTLGTLAGQTSLMDSSFDLLFNRPSAGVWNFALLLREWTAGGYVTRDFINFDLPVQFEAPVQPAPVVIAPVALPEVQPVVAVTSAVTEVAPQPSARIQVEAPVEKAPVVVPVAKAAVAAPASPAKAVAQPPAAKPTVVSVNAAGVDELAAVKGMPRKVAEGIVKRRPFKSLDDLTKIKGMGVKLLEKLRVHLKL